MLSENAEKIIRLLIQEDNEYITISKISKILQISERSIYNYMDEVVAYCEEKNYIFHKKRGKGIAIEAVAEEREKNLQDSNEYQIEESKETQKYRITYIIRTLITCEVPYTGTLFASDLFVSKSTIYKDIEAANLELEKEGLRIERKSGKGIQIIGSEFDKRKVLVRLNKGLSGKAFAVVEYIKDYRLCKDDYARLIALYKKEVVDAVIESIQDLEKRIEYQLNDYTFVMAVEYISNQMNRIQNNQTLDQNIIQRLTLNEAVSEWADYLVRKLNAKLNMNIDPREGLYIYIILLATEDQISSKVVDKKILLDKEIMVDAIADNMIHYISTILNKNYLNDSILKTSLTLFLNSSLIRVKFGFKISNSYINEVKENFGAIFSACLTISEEYEELVGRHPGEEEISYMANLFSGAEETWGRNINTLLVESVGVGLAQIIARKIEYNISAVNVTKIQSVKANQKENKNSYDLVITTSPSLIVEHPNVVYVSPIISKQDIYRVRKMCKSLLEEEKNKNEISIENLIKEELIFIEEDVILKEDLLRKMCQILYEKGYVKKEFTENVLQRERICASNIGGGIAIPHGETKMVKKPVVLVVKLDHKIEWGNGVTDVIFLLALNFEDVASTQAFFGTFYEMTLERKTSMYIRKARTTQQIYNSIIGYL